MPLASAPRPTPPAYAHAPIDGFTSIELMVTVAIVGVLAALAVPSFQTLMERWRVRQASNDLESAFYLARSEAIKRGGKVTMEKYPNTQGGCQNASTAQEWGCGWVICLDENNNGTCNAKEPKLQEVRLPGDVNIMRKPSGKSLKFTHHGMANGGNMLSFTLSPAATGVSSSATRTVCISSGGRVRIRAGKAIC